ncbi:MAG: alpha/beta hydrolase [Spongiibacteraceae bacterium]|nr:alpha/beta hydrolase [Spongiibacteraceae bacterium]
MTSNHSLHRVISRINATYGSWNKNTSTETMRSDWDKLFARPSIAAITEDFQFEHLACRWFSAPEITHPAIVLYIHGGGFRLGSIDSHQALMSDIACATGCRVLGFNYRLMPDASAPAPLEDSLSLYRYLLEQGYSAQHIVVAGDSAGGGVAASLLQYIKQQQSPALPQAAACLLLSAWLDMTLSGDSYTSRAAQDPVHQTKMLALLAKLYAGEQANLKDPLLSALFGELSDLPPTLIQVGDCEVGLDDSVSYARQLQAAQSSVDISVWPEMIHVFQMFADELPQARQAITEMANFIHKVIQA